MIDSREALRETYARWLRVRANVRALEASVDAAHHALRRDARRTGDRDVAILAEQLAGERRAIDALARDLDARIDEVKREGAFIETESVGTIVTAAKTARRRADAGRCPDSH